MAKPAVTPPRFPLILAPTPLHRLDRLSERLGVDLWIKRDDLTGFAMGGNKGRKLEYLIGKAVAEGFDAVVTCGATQSNFVRQLAVACGMSGLSCHVAAMALPYEFGPPVDPPATENGNLALTAWTNLDLRLFPDGTWDELFASAEALAQEVETSGRRVLRIPVGGSSPLGAYAFRQAGDEVADHDFATILTASSSGSTQVGLTQHFFGTSTHVVGVACDPEPDIADDFNDLANGLEALLGGSREWSRDDFDLDFGFVGPGYGVSSEEGNAAIRLLVETEGIYLDPIYSGKAFAALLHRARNGELPGKTLFWHTGGQPALFAHRPLGLSG